LVYGSETANPMKKAMGTETIRRKSKRKPTARRPHVA
jgi:hypothetical protein